MSENNNAQGNASGRNHKILLGVCAVVIVALVGVIVTMMNRQPESDNADASEPLRREVLVTEDNVEEAIAELSQPTEAPPSYRVKMSTTWHFEDGASVSSDAYVENADTNKTPVYFDVILDSGETVLESPVIPIGENMKNIKLDKELSAGRYPAVIVYHLVDENQETLTTVRMGVTLDIAH
jgi:flagellar basal body-associated protein FliL